MERLKYIKGKTYSEIANSYAQNSFEFIAGYMDMINSFVCLMPIAAIMLLFFVLQCIIAYLAIAIDAYARFVQYAKIKVNQFLEKIGLKDKLK